MEKKSDSGESQKRSSTGRRETSERKPGDSDSKSDAPPPADQPAKNRRKRAGDEGGWMTSNSEGNASRHAAVPMPVDEDDGKDAQQSSANRDKHMQDDNDEIVLIPDLDEDGGADSDQRIAHAPRNVNRRIPTLKELENEAKAAVPTSEEGLNLSVLLTTLVPASMVKEEDTAWTFESLLREITDELSNTPKTVISVTIPSETSSKQTTAAPTAAPSKSKSSSGNKENAATGAGGGEKSKESTNKSKK